MGSADLVKVRPQLVNATRAWLADSYVVDREVLGWLGFRRRTTRRFGTCARLVCRSSASRSIWGDRTRRFGSSSRRRAEGVGALGSGVRFGCRWPSARRSLGVWRRAFRSGRSLTGWAGRRRRRCCVEPDWAARDCDVFRVSVQIARESSVNAAATRPWARVSTPSSGVTRGDR
jgi:hypothetical protein